MKLAFVLAMALSMVGCGPSTKEIRTAKAAEYNAPPKHLMDLALQVTQFNYKIGAIDIEGLKFSTEPQWYTPDGGRLSSFDDGSGEYVNAGGQRPSADGGRRSEGDDYQVWFVVKVRLVGSDKAMVEITPRTFQVVVGSPQPREILADDPSLPPWVQGRADTLALAIYEHARKKYLPPGG
ncbi:MAG: hypothetical protein ACKV2T_42405 [Kofleriaceae bacterium]